MSLKEYISFLVNNRERLVELFNKIGEITILYGKETDILEKEWSKNVINSDVWKPIEEIIKE